MKLAAGRWPLWYRIPLRLSRAELWWLAALFLAWAYAQQQYEQFRRELFARYNTPAYRRLEAVAMRPSPFLQRIMRDAG